MKVPQFMPYVDMEDYASLEDSFRDNWITEGPKSKIFSERLRDHIGVRYGCFAPNGTLAIYLALRAAGIGQGDEVIVPDFTFIATANAVEMVGATPVFVDIDPKNLQIDVKKCEAAITERTAAIMPAHLYGFSCDLIAIRKICNRHNLALIEDASQAFGVEHNGIPCGSMGDLATFSFFADKTITTGEGGFVVTNCKCSYNSMLYLRNQGRIDRGTFIHPEIGYNFRMTDIQASLGISQLDKLGEIIRLKSNIHAHYTERLADVEEVMIYQPSEEITSFIPFRVVMKVENGPSQGMMDFMKASGIEPRTFFYPLHKQPCFAGYMQDERYQDASFTASTHAYSRGVCLPSYASLTEEQVDYVCDTVKEYLANG